MMTYCVFLSGTIPDENLRRFLLHVTFAMLQANERSATVTFTALDDGPVGEGNVSTKGELVVFGTFTGVKCELTASIGNQTVRATVLAKPTVTPAEARHIRFEEVGFDFFFPDSVSPMAEA